MNQVSLETGKHLGSYVADSGLCNGRGEVSLLYMCMYVCVAWCLHVFIHVYTCVAAYVGQSMTSGVFLDCPLYF